MSHPSQISVVNGVHILHARLCMECKQNTSSFPIPVTYPYYVWSMRNGTTAFVSGMGENRVSVGIMRHHFSNSVREDGNNMKLGVNISSQ